MNIKSNPAPKSNKVAKTISPESEPVAGRPLTLTLRVTLEEDRE